jgi:hypothetical protein
MIVVGVLSLVLGVALGRRFGALSLVPVSSAMALALTVIGVWSGLTILQAIVFAFLTNCLSNLGYLLVALASVPRSNLWHSLLRGSSQWHR